MIAEALWGIAVPAFAAMVSVYAVKQLRSVPATRLWVASFGTTCLVSSLLILGLAGVDPAVFGFAVCGNALCVLMIYALITRSISFDLLAAVAARRDSGVKDQALLEGDPLNVRARLAQLERMRMVVVDRSCYRTSRAGTVISRCMVAPLYWVRRNER